MKNMKMLLGALLIGACAAPVLKAGEWYGGTITVPAGSTNVSSVVELFRKFGPGVSAIDKVEVYRSSGSGTGTVSFVTYDLDVDGVVVATSTALSTPSLYTTNPRAVLTVPYVQTTVQNVQTGAWYVAVTTVNTNIAAQIAQYQARKVKVNVAQPAAAADTVYQWAILTGNE